MTSCNTDFYDKLLSLYIYEAMWPISYVVSILIPGCFDNMATPMSNPVHQDHCAEFFPLLTVFHSFLMCSVHDCDD